MTKIMKYQSYNESLDVSDDDIIINNIIPFAIKKYDELSKWGYKKTYHYCVPLNELMFLHEDGKWTMKIVANGWSTNKSNTLIQYVLNKSIRDEGLKYGLYLDKIDYSGGHTISDSVDKYIVYDVIKKEFIKQKI